MRAKIKDSIEDLKKFPSLFPLNINHCYYKVLQQKLFKDDVRKGYNQNSN